MSIEAMKAEKISKQLPIYYMRDNHTFRLLSEDVSTALIEIEQDFNEGWTHGMLCSKRKNFTIVHANGNKDRLNFFAECKKVLENQLPPKREWVGLTDEEIEVVSGNYTESEGFKHGARWALERLKDNNNG